MRSSSVGLALGCLSLHLHIDDSVPPVAQPACCVPFHLRKQMSEEQEQLERQGINEKVDGVTPWVSPLVVTPKKNGSVRLCVDMRRPNEAIREVLCLELYNALEQVEKLLSQLISGLLSLDLVNLDINDTEVTGLVAQ